MNQDNLQDQEPKDLSVVLKEFPIDNGEQIHKAFAPFFQEAKSLEAEARALVVTSADQYEEMNRASDMRKALKRIRIDAEKTKKTLKEDVLLRGRAIDGMFNIIQFAIKPLEEHLEQQEKFAELLAEKEKAELKSKREAELTQYGVDVTFIHVEDMPADVYENFLAKAKKEFDDKVEAEKKAEADRLEKERLDKVEMDRRLEFAPYSFLLVSEAPDFRGMRDHEFTAFMDGMKKAKASHDEEQERIKAENESLKKRDEVKNARIASLSQLGLRFNGESFIFKDEAHKAFIEVHHTEILADTDEQFEGKLGQIRKEIARVEDAIREEATAKRDQEEKTKAELAAMKEKEERERQEAEAKAKEDEENRRKALLSPDKDKLIKLAEAIASIDLPVLTDKKAQSIAKGVQTLLGKTVAFIQEKTQEL